MAAVMEQKIDERVCNPLSNAELDRRWKAARAHMRSAGIDALVMQNSNDFLGGYVRWFSGQPATHAYPRAVIFPLEGLVTIVQQGDFDMAQRFEAGAPQPDYGI